MGGIKHDSGKVDYTMIPVIAIEELGKVFEYGKKKYTKDNWKSVEANRIKASAYRHWLSYLKGEDLDSESGLPHLAHLLSNICMLVYFRNEQINGNTINNFEVDKVSKSQ